MVFLCLWRVGSTREEIPKARLLMECFSPQQYGFQNYFKGLKWTCLSTASQSLIQHAHMKSHLREVCASRCRPQAHSFGISLSSETTFVPISSYTIYLPMRFEIYTRIPVLPLSSWKCLAWMCHRDFRFKPSVGLLVCVRAPSPVPASDRQLHFLPEQPHGGVGIIQAARNPQGAEPEHTQWHQTALAGSSGPTIYGWHDLQKGV